jgi:hypothetical protein
LTSARSFISSFSISNKLYFAGGNVDANRDSSVIDVYDSNSNVWSLDSLVLSIPRTNIASIACQNFGLFVSGFNTSSQSYLNVVDMYDANSGLMNTSMGVLTGGRGWIAAAVVSDTCYFCGGRNESGIFPSCDLFNVTQKAWFSMNLLNALIPFLLVLWLLP